MNELGAFDEAERRTVRWRVAIVKPLTARVGQSGLGALDERGSCSAQACVGRSSGLEPWIEFCIVDRAEASK